MIVVGVILVTIWLCGVLGYATLSLMNGESTKVMAMSLFWPILLLADCIYDWAYPEEEDGT